jgi:coproporphyrinogen III oxidase-like Fe-S oxidoreductase
MELVSSKPKQLNSINANNLDLILPYIVDTLERYNSDLENQLEAIIQRIHCNTFQCLLEIQMRHRSISIQIPQIKIISLRKLF